MTCNSIFMKVWLILTELFMFFITILTLNFFFLFHNFRAYFGLFGQSKSTSFINWILFGWFETARISIFIEVLLILAELFTIFIIVLIPEFFFPFYNFRIYLVKWNKQRKLTEIKFKPTCILIWIDIYIFFNNAILWNFKKIDKIYG